MFERFLLSFREKEGKWVLFWSTFCNASPANGILTFFEDREVKIIVDKFTRCAPTCVSHCLRRLQGLPVDLAVWAMALDQFNSKRRRSGRPHRITIRADPTSSAHIRSRSL